MPGRNGKNGHANGHANGLTASQRRGLEAQGLVGRKGATRAKIAAHEAEIARRRREAEIARMPIHELRSKREECHVAALSALTKGDTKAAMDAALQCVGWGTRAHSGPCGSD